VARLACLFVEDAPPPGWLYAAGGTNDTERFAARGDESIEVPSEVLTALCRVLPNFPQNDVNGKPGLTGAFAAALTWSLLWGDEDSCRAVTFNGHKLTLETKAFMLSQLLAALARADVVVKTTTTSVERLVILWRADLRTLDAGDLQALKLVDTCLEPVELSEGAMTAGIDAADAVTVADLRGTDGFYDVAAMLEVALKDRVTWDAHKR
jgi:hypothetical protein